MKPLMTGKEMKALRISLGLSRKWCAKKLGVTGSQFAWMERHIEVPDAARVLILRACSDALHFRYEGYPSEFQFTLAGLQLRGWGPKLGIDNEPLPDTGGINFSIFHAIK